MFASGAGYACATRKHGERKLILQALCACKISAVNEECTNRMLPSSQTRVSTKGNWQMINNPFYFDPELDPSCLFETPTDQGDRSLPDQLCYEVELTIRLKLPIYIQPEVIQPETSWEIDVEHLHSKNSTSISQPPDQSFRQNSRDPHAILPLELHLLKV
jgi:hypothetical protein